MAGACTACGEEVTSSGEHTCPGRRPDISGQYTCHECGGLLMLIQHPGGAVTIMHDCRRAAAAGAASPPPDISWPLPLQASCNHCYCIAVADGPTALTSRVTNSATPHRVCCKCGDRMAVTNAPWTPAPGSTGSA